MPDDETTEITPDRRKEIFLAVVEAQDSGMPVARSRAAVAERFGVSEAEVRDIEREGLAAQWPPL
ncbi:hypothetical protein J0H58_25625 [bacterium]|nr:hypothetical protein [bacterium]